MVFHLATGTVEALVRHPCITFGIGGDIARIVALIRIFQARDHGRGWRQDSAA